MIKAKYSKTLFHTLAIGLNHIYPNHFQEIALNYDHYVSFSSLIDEAPKNKYSHVFLISQNQKNYLDVIKNLKIVVPHSLSVVIAENPAGIQELVDSGVLFMYIDRADNTTTENSLHQLWRWLLTLGYQKVGIDNSEIVLAGGILSFSEETYTKNDKLTKLTGKQIAMLKLFINYRGEVVSRKMLLDNVWNDDTKIVTDRVIDTNVVALRKMLGDKGRDPIYLQTIFGQGYRLHL